MVRKYKPRVIPEQDRRICGSICLCQLTLVLSSVSLVYLSVAIYMPSHRAFNSGFESDPVMCQTYNATMALSQCSWASCGEWCLTKTSGFCPQLHAIVRRNGTELLMENCTRIMLVSCPQVDTGALKRYNCNNGSECASLHGVFNCSLGHCANLSELYLCHHKADGIVVDSEKDNMKLNGFFECVGSRCVKIKRPFHCDRYCPRITTFSQNTFLMFEDNLYSAECSRAVALSESNGPDPGGPIEPTEIWNSTSEKGALLASCHSIVRTADTLRGSDCLNGTLLEPSLIGRPTINFTTFWGLYNGSRLQVDPEHRFLPKQSALTIYESRKILINLEGCVNTLRSECIEFLVSHGSDGDNQTAQSRYPCYYNKNPNITFVVARFDLDKTWTELLIAAIVPTVLFVISFTTLCIITNSVKVGDDAKMRCRCCRGASSSGESPPDDLDIGLGIQAEPSEPSNVVGDDEEEEELEGAVGMTLDRRNSSRILEEDRDLKGIIAVMPLSPSTETSEGIGGDERPLVKPN